MTERPAGAVKSRENKNILAEQGTPAGAAGGGPTISQSKKNTIIIKKERR